VVKAAVRIVIDRTRCVGAGQCVRVAPEVFDQDEGEGLVLLLEANPAPDVVEYARKAALLCPARAITLEESA
jgi:ferredoxin